jgi:hypothetical protein
VRRYYTRPPCPKTRASKFVKMSLREPDGLLRKLEAEVNH